MSKQDRQGVRTPAGLEQKYDFGKRFREAKDTAAKTAADLEAAQKNFEAISSNVDASAEDIAKAQAAVIAAKQVADDAASKATASLLQLNSLADAVDVKISALAESVQEQLNELYSYTSYVEGGDSLLQKVYSVGKLYFSTDETSPASLFGGTWERIKDVFLLAAGDTYSAGATGGAETVKIAEENLPYYAMVLRSATTDGQWTTGKWSNTTSVSTGDNIATMNGSGSHTTSAEIDNMPPYLAVYVWKRVA